MFATRRTLRAARREAAFRKGEALALRAAVTDLVAAVDANLTQPRSKDLQDALTAARYAASLDDPRAAQYHQGNGWGR